MTGNISLEKKYEQLIRYFSGQITEHPMAYTQLLAALGFMVGPSKEIVIIGDRTLNSTQAMIAAVHKRFLPNKVLLFRPQGLEGKRIVGLSPFMEPMAPMNQQPTVFLCEQYACQTPITDLDQLNSALH